MTDTEALLAAAICEANPGMWPSTCTQEASTYLATPSGQRLLAPTERERALEAALGVIASHDEDDEDTADCFEAIMLTVAALARPAPEEAVS
jgi:hypothetical protein